MKRVVLDSGLIIISCMVLLYLAGPETWLICQKYIKMQVINFSGSSDLSQSDHYLRISVHYFPPLHKPKKRSFKSI